MRLFEFSIVGFRVFGINNVVAAQVLSTYHAVDVSGSYVVVVVVGR